MVGADNDSSSDDTSSAGDGENGTFPPQEPEPTESKIKLDALVQEVQQLRQELGYPRRKSRRTMQDDEDWGESEHDEAM